MSIGGIKMKNKINGENGEDYVIQKIKCPNCNSALIKLPENNPLFDIQCCRCVFRAQIKSSNLPPSKNVRGAGYDIIDKINKGGFLIPMLIVYYKWNGNHKILFYPFIKKENIKRNSHPLKNRPNYYMFNYIRLDKLNPIELFKN